MRPPIAAGAGGDTIYALATGAGRSAISIIRISGPECRRVVEGMCRLPMPRVASVRTLRNPMGELLDQAVVLWLPGPSSYSGEDSAELHLHGGRAVLEGVSTTLAEAGARAADPGEFTRRAFLNGKLDLLTSEAVADLSSAETAEQRRRALRQLSGEQSVVVGQWSAKLVSILAWFEAQIDFSDEDVRPDIGSGIQIDLADLLSDIRQHLAAAPSLQRLRRGLVFVISGPPNVGKSSLLNVLAGYQAAIVSPHPGTTRDPVSVELVLKGVPVTLVDTAGIRDTYDPIEIEGVRLARSKAEAADAVLSIAEAGSGMPPDASDAGLRVTSKIDLGEPFAGTIGVSTVTRHGLAELQSAMANLAESLVHTSVDPVISNARHQSALASAENHLSLALARHHPEVAAEELRLALQALGRISGEVDSEQVLDQVFGAFCIGK